jgi:hypothetical protein
LFLKPKERASLEMVVVGRVKELDAQMVMTFATMKVERPSSTEQDQIGVAEAWWNSSRHV